MAENSDSKQAWKLPKWPWELEVFTILFMLLAIALPFYVHNLEPAPGSIVAELNKTNPAEAALAEQRGMLWSVSILGLYFFHIIVARGTLDLISTPITTLLAPPAFATIAYFRTLILSRDMGQNIAFVTGSIGQILLIAASVIIVSLVLARLHMTRYMLNFRQTKWDIASPALMDKTYTSLLSELRPLLYLPRRYRAAEQGILIEGWFYVMVMPFRMVQSISAVNYAGMGVTGNYFATSTHTLIRVEMTESNTPVFISPAERDEFLRYCVTNVLRLKRSGAAGSTSSGDLAGMSRTQRVTLQNTQSSMRQTQQIRSGGTQAGNVTKPSQPN